MLLWTAAYVLGLLGAKVQAACPASYPTQTTLRRVYRHPDLSATTRPTTAATFTALLGTLNSTASYSSTHISSATGAFSLLSAADWFNTEDEGTARIFELQGHYSSANPSATATPWTVTLSLTQVAYSYQFFVNDVLVRATYDSGATFPTNTAAAESTDGCTVFRLVLTINAATATALTPSLPITASIVNNGAAIPIANIVGFPACGTTTQTIASQTVAVAHQFYHISGRYGANVIESEFGGRGETEADRLCLIDTLTEIFSSELSKTGNGAVEVSASVLPTTATTGLALRVRFARSGTATVDWNTILPTTTATSLNNLLQAAFDAGTLACEDGSATTYKPTIVALVENGTEQTYTLATGAT